MCPGSEGGGLVQWGLGAVVRDVHRGRRCMAGLAACLHGNLEAGFKKTKPSAALP